MLQFTIGAGGELIPGLPIEMQAAAEKWVVGSTERELGPHWGWWSIQGSHLWLQVTAGQIAKEYLKYEGMKSYTRYPT